MGSITLPQLDLSPFVSAVNDVRNNYLEMQRQDAQIKLGQAQVGLLDQENKIQQDLLQNGDYASWEEDYKQRMSEAIDKQASTIPLPNMADTFRNGMMMSVEKNLPNIRTQAQTQMDASATARAQTDLNSAIQGGAPVEQTTTVYLAHFGSQDKPAEVLMRKAGYNLDVAKTLWKQGMDQTVQATAAQQVQTIVSDTNLSATKQLEQVQLVAKRYSDPTRMELQPAREVMNKAIETLKPEVSNETLSAASVSVSDFNSKWDPVVLNGGTFEVGTKNGGTATKTVVQKTRQYAPDASITVEGQTFKNPIEALDALNKGGFASLDTKDRETLGKILEGSAQHFNMVNTGLMSEGVSKALDAKVAKYKTMMATMSQTEKWAFWQRNGQFKDDPMLAGRLVDDLSKDSVLDPIFKDDINKGMAALDKNPELQKVFSDFVQTHSSMMLRGGADPMAAKTTLTNFLADLKAQDSQSVVNRLLKISQAPQAGQADQIAQAATDKTWLSNVFYRASQGALPTNTTLKDELGTVLTTMLPKIQANLKTYLSSATQFKQTDRGITFEVTGPGIYGSKQTDTFRLMGDGAGGSWIEKKDGNNWTKTTGDLFQPFTMRPADSPEKIAYDKRMEEAARKQQANSDAFRNAKPGETVQFYGLPKIDPIGDLTGVNKPRPAIPMLDPRKQPVPEPNLDVPPGPPKPGTPVLNLNLGPKGTKKP